MKISASAKAADPGFIFIPLLRALFGNVERLCIVYDEYGPYICACRLSANLPFCDGSHKLTKGEGPGKLHWYDEDRTRHDAKDVYPEIRSDA